MPRARVFRPLATLAVACALAAAGATPGFAQAPRAEAAAAPAAACFRPGPPSACRSFWITEFGVSRIVTDPPGYEDYRRTLVTWEAGRMFAAGGRRAVGGTLFLASNDNQFRFGVRARHRTWGPAGAALDLSAGLILLHSDVDLAVEPALGVDLQAAVAPHDWLAGLAQLEHAPGGTSAMVGGRLGSLPGAAVGLFLPLLAWVRFGIYDES